MRTCNLASTNLESLAERGLSSFLRAVGEGASGEDLERAGDCWIRAMERTEWGAGESADRFIRRVTVRALAGRGGDGCGGL